MGFPYSPKLLSTSTRFLPCKRWRERLVDLRGSQCFVFLALVIPIAFLVSLSTPSEDQAQVLDKQAKLAEQTFWDNRDFDWFAQSIPFFECPDADITTTYYYRWELLTKHLTYGSPKADIALPSLSIARFGLELMVPSVARRVIRSMRLDGYGPRESPMTIAATGCELQVHNHATTRLG